MKFHKNYDNYLNFLSANFPDIPNIEIIFRNFNVLATIIDNKNSVCAEEISYEVDLSEQRIRVKLRELENEGIINFKKKKQINNSYKKKYYSTLLTGDFIEEFREYISCCKCGKKLGKFGGIIHSNIERSVCPEKIFCSTKCRNEWCYKSARDNNR